MCIWRIAADTFGFDDSYITDIVYINSPVKKFLDADSSMGISACKGMVKTFLLKAKRMLMMEKNPSYLFLPQDQLVDTPSPIVLNRNQIKFLSSYSNWVSIWTFCICAYILSQGQFKSLVESETIEPHIDSKLYSIVSSTNDGIYHVLNKLIAEKNAKILRAAIEAVGILFPITQRINRQIAIFVDKIEEPFNRGYYKINGSTSSAEGKYNSSIWAYAQLAFAEAVYILYSGRHHTKIFYSIREEARWGAESVSVEYPKFSRDMMISLRYSSEDLYKMFAKYVAAEKDENLFVPEKKVDKPLIALCGVEELKHRSGSVESLWAYLERHSLKRPRDIMDMCATIYDNIILSSDTMEDYEQRARTCRHWVNQISTKICREYLYVLEPFMCSEDNFAFAHQIEDFFSQLPTNVFTPNTMLTYCHRQNDSDETTNCNNCANPHYFSTLYNIGLLGYIYKSESENGYKNSIKSLGDCIFSMYLQTLPKGVLYYVHPGISNIIKEMRERSMQLYTASNMVINSAEIFVNQEQIYRAQHLAEALLGNSNEKRIFLSSTDRDLRYLRTHVKELLEKQGYEVVCFESPEFPEMPSDMQGPAATHDHCIDVALTCKHLLYIYGGTFGGKYSGTKYSMYIKENPIIKIRPSVSFMEYLVSKKYLKNVHVFVPSKIDVAKGEYQKNGSPENYKSNAVDDTKVFTQLSYFNSLENGTWYNTYSDVNELDKFLRTVFPVLSY